MRLSINKPVIVEGKYDKIRLSEIIDARIITTEGFSIFRTAEKAGLIRKLAEPCGIIVLTDSDGAGLLIRNYINSILPKDKITHLYIPEVEGKEKRKKEPSKSGLVGVEGIDREKLTELFLPLCGGTCHSVGREITKADLYELGLSGSENSQSARRRLASALGLPQNLSSNALLSYVNYLYTYEQIKDMLK